MPDHLVFYGLLLSCGLIAAMWLRLKQDRAAQCLAQQKREREHAEVLAGLEHQLQERAQLMADLVQEVRLPLRGIAACADRQLRMDDEQSVNIGAIASAARRTERLLDNYGERARTGIDRRQVAARPLDIGALLHQSAAIMAPLAQASDLALGVWIDDSIPDQVELDQDKLRLALAILIANAIHHTSDGGVDIEARIESASDGQHLLVSVLDSGAGIASEKLSLLLNPAPDARPSPYGLAHASNLVRSMHGQMVVQSKPGAGSSFTLRLPLRACSQTGSAKRPKPQVDSNQVALLQGRRILVVEHDEMSRHLVETLCARMGIDTLFALSGEAALDRLKSAADGDHGFDVLLLDLQLPGLGGLETAARLRGLPACGAHELPLITMGQLPQGHQTAHDHGAGINAHLPKPLTSVALARELARCLINAPPRRCLPTGRRPLRQAR